MKVKEDNKEFFAESIFNLFKAIKNEADDCGKLCGGLNEKELIVIIYIGQNENVKMSDISENIEAPMSTLTSIVDKLVERKYLIRDHSAEDRRVINVSLTSNGKTAYKTIHAKRKKMAEKILSQLNEKEQTIFIRHLNLLTSSIITKT
ncbi:MAG TPA: MarR family transcriptional regulator [Puia sp.]|jgi:DNA-binding MarR family transcriptional regulator|nr:MarR family transcriptional regulator [Puia sp.]